MKKKIINYENCSAKGCNNIPEYEHKGMEIALCPICYKNSGMEKHNFIRLNNLKILD